MWYWLIIVVLEKALASVEKPNFFTICNLFMRALRKNVQKNISLFMVEVLEADLLQKLLQTTTRDI